MAATGGGARDLSLPHKSVCIYICIKRLSKSFLLRLVISCNMEKRGSQSKLHVKLLSVLSVVFYDFIIILATSSD